MNKVQPTPTNIASIIGKRKAEEQISTTKVQSQAMQGSEIAFSDLNTYEKVILQWFKQASDLSFQSKSFDEADNKIIRASLRLMNALIIEILDRPYTKNHFFVAKTGDTVHSLGIARFSNEEAEILYMASDPQNLPLKDRKNNRIRGGGTEIVQTIAKSFSRIYVDPADAAGPFYEKLGFMRLTDKHQTFVRLSDRYLVLEKPAKTKVFTDTYT